MLALFAIFRLENFLGLLDDIFNKNKLRLSLHIHPHSEKFLTFMSDPLFKKQSALHVHWNRK